MRVIPPLTITDAMLTSSTCAEPYSGETIYSGATTYALGDLVISTTAHRMYESLAASNTGNPLPVLPETETTKWLDIGPTNKWAMFDLFQNTDTNAASPLTVVLTPGVRCNSIALLGLTADSYRVSMTSSAVSVYDTETVALSTRDVHDWYDYFFEPFNFTENIVLFDIPPYSNGIITVELNRASGDAGCSSLVLGSFVYLGRTQYNAETDALNFSTVERDEFGTATLIPRRSIPVTSQTVWADANTVNAIRDVRTALNAAPAVWSGLDDVDQDYFDALVILGFYRKFLINLAKQDFAILNLELEEI